MHVCNCQGNSSDATAIKFWNFPVSPTQSQLAGEAINNSWKEN